jgi:hypothetical protein
MQQRRQWLLLTAIMVLLVGLVFSAEAQKPAPPVSTASVGPVLDIWSGDSTKDDVTPVVAYNPTLNEYLVVWVTKQDEFTWDIWGRRVNANGENLGFFNVQSMEATLLTNPAVVYNPVSTKYLVVFEVELSSTNRDIYAVLMAADFSSHSDFILENTTDDAYHPSLTCNTSNGDYLLAFTQESADRSVIKLWRFYSDFNSPGSTSIASAADQYRSEPDVAYAPLANKYLITYSYYTNTPFANRIRGKVVAADLTDLASATEQFYDGDYNGKFGPAAAGSENEFLVSWTSTESSAWSIFARRVNSSGVPQASEFEIALPPPYYMRDSPDVAFAPGFGYLIPYRDWLTTSTDDGDIGGRYVRPGQDMAWQSNFWVDDNVNLQNTPAVACSPVKCLVVYSHNVLPYPGSEYVIRGRFVYPFGTYIPLLKNP